MKLRDFFPRFTFLATAVALLLAAPAFAGGPLANCASGQPFLWPGGGVNIPFNPDMGPLGLLTNAQAVALTQQAFDAWGNLPTASATYTNAGPLPVDVDIMNVGPYLNPGAPDGLSAIVFDDTGEIFDAIFGPGSGILGFAGPEWVNTTTCEILEGRSFLNGPSFGDLTAAEDVMVHEFGHYSNLAHTELNGQLVTFSEGGDNSGPTPDDVTFGLPGFVGTEVIETMYPFYFGPVVGTRTPHADDVAMLSTLYPAPSFFATTGSISGTILGPNGTTRLTGVNVIARNIADPFVDSVSAISGDFSDSTTDQSDAVVGTYALNGLTPGAHYRVFVDAITAAPGRFSTPATVTLPGPEEWWNGAGESNTDDPTAFEDITAMAGSPSVGVDVIFNTAPEGAPLPVGDDGSVLLFIPFEFTICQQPFDSVFVNANGNLTFGAGDSDFSASAAELLSGPPRIAGVWDDLSPNFGGSVIYNTTDESLTVTWENVPEFPNIGSNNFSITLKKKKSHIDVAYGALSAVDGLAGISCGIRRTSSFETEIDLSAATKRIKTKNEWAAYELFSASDNDLANVTLAYDPKTKYKDKFEPNNSIEEVLASKSMKSGKKGKSGKSRKSRKSRKSMKSFVELPFDTIDTKKRFSEISPAAGDVDYYGFEAEGGTTLVAEILHGQLDSVIGVFDENGTLLNNPVFDDDAGHGLLSKTLTPIPADGTYFLAVSFCCDYDLDGIDPGQGLPLDEGRYVLDAFLVDGTVLPLGDDSSVEVALSFDFPFQGNNWSSVFVNANGNLTFGTGDANWTESAAAFLGGPPRIAPLWDDLSPNAGGMVVFKGDAVSATITFLDVPEFPNLGANSFAVTLSDTGEVTMGYGAVSAIDGLTGVTEGGGAVDLGETDLSAGGPLSATGTTYQMFDFLDPFDLGFLGLLFGIP